VNKLLWIDFQYQNNKDILKIILNRMKNFNYHMNSKNIQNNHKRLIYLEYTMVKEEEFNNASKTNYNSYKANYSNTLNDHRIPEVWSLSQYLCFLKAYNIYTINEPIPFDKQLELLDISAVKVKQYIDISSDYEKTLWCWCHRLKQAIESNTKHDLYHNALPPSENDHYGSVYLSFLLQTIALFQQQKLKRYQLIFYY